IAADLAMKSAHVALTWSRWIWASIVPGLMAFAIVPWLVYKLAPPGIRHTPQAEELARKELAAMGPLSFAEKKVIGVFLLVCGLWATSSFHNIATTTVALLGVAVLLAMRSLQFSDLTNDHNAW